jgi:hypothetical protein
MSASICHRGCTPSVSAVCVWVKRRRRGVTLKTPLPAKSAGIAASFNNSFDPTSRLFCFHLTIVCHTDRLTGRTIQAFLCLHLGKKEDHVSEVVIDGGNHLQRLPCCMQSGNEQYAPVGSIERPSQYLIMVDGSHMSAQQLLAGFFVFILVG